MAAVGAVAAVALAGCSGVGGTNVAAVVNGHVITETEAQKAASEINTAFQLKQPLTTKTALGSLINAPFIIDVAAKNGHPQSEAAARQALSAIDNPSDGAIQLVRANAAFQTLAGADQAAIISELKKADVSVNPRYGTYDPSRGSLVASVPNWISTPKKTQG